LISRSRFASRQKEESREATRRVPKPQRTDVQQTAPAWTDGWSWREDSGYRGSWNNSSQGWWSGNQQRSRERTFW